MNILKNLRRISGAVVLAVALCGTASATDVLNVNSIVGTSDPSQLGRLSRNGIPQDWSGSEPYPGVINTSTTYNYKTFVIPWSVSVLGPFIQISLLDLGPTNGNLFAAAYANSYNPASPSATWLGDEGFSGNVFGVNPGFFQVIVPTGANLVIVINTTVAGLNGEGFNLLVESFSDRQYSPARAPESGATALLLTLGVAGVFVTRRYLPARA
jgi:hypothetical protein